MSAQLLHCVHVLGRQHNPAARVLGVLQTHKLCSATKPQPVTHTPRHQRRHSRHGEKLVPRAVVIVRTNCCFDGIQRQSSVLLVQKRVVRDAHERCDKASVPHTQFISAIKCNKSQRYCSKSRVPLAPPASYLKMCDLLPRITSSPRPQCTPTLIRLPIVPLQISTQSA